MQEQNRIQQGCPAESRKKMGERTNRQWWSQEFRLGGARLKDKIENKKLININNKISKELYDNLIVIQNLT